MTTPIRIPVAIEDEMKRSYLDYAMSVIIGRALPDVRDGLKPAHRRVLYGMRLMGLVPNRPSRKCAKIVGEVMGNFHPHGDQSIYDTLVRLAQDFNMRYPLVDGQGNFGSMDGDPAAAMRYTEARLEALADDMMADLGRDTVDFTANYDETTEEPVVLPTPFPNLLVNGSSGIAVGMATNIPPHNLREVIDAVLAVTEPTLEGPRLARDERQRRILQLVRGPDFPTGGIIVGKRGMYDAYRSGRGTITLRGRTTIEDLPRGDRQAIVVTEIPFQVNKAKLVERIAELVREKIVEGISDVRDESDREGLRIVIELKRDTLPDVVLNNLYKHSALQTSFGMIMLAVVGGRPRVLPLVDLIEHFVEFRREVVRRRTEFELKKAEARAHILEGLKIALDHLDAVIALIRGARSPAAAREGLRGQFGLTEIQAQAILDMQLQRLTGLERQKIVDELAEVLKTIERLRSILGSDRLLMEIVVKELRDVRDQYGDERRSEILEQEGEDFRMEDLIPDEDMAITVSGTGYIKRTAISAYRAQARGGKGRRGMTLRAEDYVSHLFVASSHAYLLVFSDRGRAYWLRVYEIPDVGPDGKGKAIANLVQMAPEEKVAAIVAVREWPAAEGEQFIVMGTHKGVVKKTDLHAFRHPRAGGIIAMGVDADDRVIAARRTEGSHEIVMATRQGMSIRFAEGDVRSMGRTAYGVRGVALREDDEVVGLNAVTPGGAVLTVTAHGYGKRTLLEEYRLQSRGGVGVINIQASERNGPVIGMVYVTGENELMLVTQKGKVLRMPTATLRPIGRATQGVRLIDIEEDDRVVAIARLDIVQENDENGEGTEGAESEPSEGDTSTEE